jgi:hypothetical protein
MLRATIEVGNVREITGLASFRAFAWLEDLPQSWQLPTGIPVPTDPVSMIDPLPAGHGMSWQMPTRCPAATRYAGFCGSDPI